MTTESNDKPARNPNARPLGAARKWSREQGIEGGLALISEEQRVAVGNAVLGLQKAQNKLKRLKGKIEETEQGITDAQQVLERQASGLRAVSEAAQKAADEFLSRQQQGDGESKGDDTPEPATADASSSGDDGAPTF